jgi:hypothetical protein
MTQEEKINKLIDWCLNQRKEKNREYAYWNGRIEGIMDAAAMFGVVIPNYRLFLTQEGADSLRPSVTEEEK